VEIQGNDEEMRDVEELVDDRNEQLDNVDINRTNEEDDVDIINTIGESIFF